MVKLFFVLKTEDIVFRIAANGVKSGEGSISPIFTAPRKPSFLLSSLLICACRALYSAGRTKLWSTKKGTWMVGWNGYTRDAHRHYLCAITEPQNGWGGKEPLETSAHPPCCSRFTQSWLLRITPRQGLNISTEGDSTTVPRECWRWKPTCTLFSLKSVICQVNPIVTNPFFLPLLPLLSLKVLHKCSYPLNLRTFITWNHPLKQQDSNIF